MFQKQNLDGKFLIVCQKCKKSDEIRLEITINVVRVCCDRCKLAEQIENEKD